MSLIGKEPELVKQFVVTARLFSALMMETNADTSTNTVKIVHHESGQKYKATLTIKKEGVEI